ncbi:MAG: Bro-N domain-containing protein [Oscillospiraceae bacterium]|nr:Bro-N domain-containing protein [Oscillospiraceae bacterium]
MNEIVKLYKENPVRIIEKDGELWFVAKDVAVILGYRDAYTLVRRLDEDERGTRKVCTPSAEQEMTVINEAGLYNAILCSNKAEAKAFKRWVTHDVLPSIRKTGAYLAPNLPLEKLQNLIETIGEQYKLLIESNSILRQQLEYATQFVPKTKYGSTSPANGQRRTTIRRGANVAGNGRLIERRNPEEVGYQMDLFGEYLPQIIFTNAVNFITNSNVKQLECCHA